MLDIIGPICVGLSISLVLILSLNALLTLLEQIVRDSVREEFRRREERCQQWNQIDNPKPNSQA